VLGERHLRHVLLSYMKYFNEARTHFITEQGCADTARCPGRRAHSVPANLGRIASPIRPDLIFDRHNHIVVLGEAHLRRILRKDAAYYNELRTHRSLNKDAPIHRAIQHRGGIVSAPILGGLHHHYCRI
jgi:hypothetical protein